jgi:hypothetical protein
MANGIFGGASILGRSALGLGDDSGFTEEPGTTTDTSDTSGNAMQASTDPGGGGAVVTQNAAVPAGASSWLNTSPGPAVYSKAPGALIQPGMILGPPISGGGGTPVVKPAPSGGGGGGGGGVPKPTPKPVPVPAKASILTNPLFWGGVLVVAAGGFLVYKKTHHAAGV